MIDNHIIIYNYTHKQNMLSEHSQCTKVVPILAIPPILALYSGTNQPLTLVIPVSS